MIKLKNRRFLLVFIAILLIATLSIASSAKESSTESDTDPLIALSYVNEVLKPQIITEVLDKLGNGTAISSSTAYNDITIESGKMLLLSTNCELIYRGGGAVIITTSTQTGDGITDMSISTEYFSGKSLLFGHVYYASESITKKCILITGKKANFTIRGKYEIR